MRKEKVLVIGLDGGTWDLVLPWIQGGILPNLKSLKEKGTWGELETTYPPATFPAWRCYSTGMNPGRFGVYGWIGVDFKQRRVTLQRTSGHNVKEIWDLLGDEGITVAAVNMPGTYPPKRVNGYLVSGPPTSSECGYTHPPWLEEELFDRFGYRVYPHTTVRHNPVEGLREIQELTSKRFKVASYLLKQVDFLHLTIFYLDHIQHYFWKNMRENDPNYGNYVRQMWTQIDREIGKLSKEAGPHASIILMSDHGFGPLNRAFFINEWLRQSGYLQTRRDWTDLLGMIGLTRSRLEFLAEKSGIKPLVQRKASRDRLFKFVMRLPDAGSDIEGRINWEKTLAVAVGQGPLYLGPNGRARKAELSNLLLRMRDPETDARIVKKIHRKEEIYEGAYLDEAPDLVVETEEGYETDSRLTHGRILGDHAEGWNGTHRREGMILLHGPRFKRDYKLHGARIYDVAPTILHLFDLPVSDEMDGSVLTDAMRE
ncbi:MAG: alkaline phosphatase family protein [Thermoplasmata archaeon]